MRGKTILLGAVLTLSGFFSARAQFSAGFGRMDITPPLGIRLAGYFHERRADGVLDPLEAIAVAFSDGTNRAVVISADIINLRGYFTLYRRIVAEQTGLDPQAVFIACTHTHTGPVVGSAHYGQSYEAFKAEASAYERSLGDRLASAARLALADLSPAALSVAKGEAKGLSFVRRYRMKDGSCRTNPGVGNPDILAPMGAADEQVQLLRIDRPGKDAIAVVNFQCHPDTIGGRKISADWPRVVRETVERCLDGVKCIFINGAQGDTNHCCTDRRHPASRRVRRTIYRQMGRAIGGEAIGLWDACEPLAAGKVGFGIATAKVKTNRGRPEQLPEAKRIMALVQEGRIDEVPGKGMQKLANRAQARRIVNLADGPDFFDFPLSAVTIGASVAFVGFPGEPFTRYGVQMKARSPFALTVPACIVNGNFGYLPEDAAFKESGYETQGSLFVEGLEKNVLDTHLEQLKKLIR